MKPIYNDMPESDHEVLTEAGLGVEELSIIFNWQFAHATSETIKLAEALNKLCPDCDIDVYLETPCDED